MIGGRFEALTKSLLIHKLDMHREEVGVVARLGMRYILLRVMSQDARFVDGSLAPCWLVRQ